MFRDIHVEIGWFSARAGRTERVLVMAKCGVGAIAASVVDDIVTDIWFIRLLKLSLYLHDTLSLPHPIEKFSLAMTHCMKAILDTNS